MDSFQWYDGVRVLTAIITVVAFYRLGHLVNEFWKEYSTRIKEFVWLIFASLFLTFEGALESVLADTGWAWRIPVQLLIACAAYWATRHSDYRIKDIKEGS